MRRKEVCGASCAVNIAKPQMLAYLAPSFTAEASQLASSPHHVFGVLLLSVAPFSAAVFLSTVAGGPSSLRGVAEASRTRAKHGQMSENAKLPTHTLIATYFLLTTASALHRDTASALHYLFVARGRMHCRMHSIQSQGRATRGLQLQHAAKSPLGSRVPHPAGLFLKRSLQPRGQQRSVRAAADLAGLLQVIIGYLAPSSMHA